MRWREGGREGKRERERERERVDSCSKLGGVGTPIEKYLWPEICVHVHVLVHVAEREFCF